MFPPIRFNNSRAIFGNQLIAIGALLKRFSVWRENLGLRGLKALHVNLAIEC
jgi:hypothetical protein